MAYTEPKFPESDDSVRATIARALELKGMVSEVQLLRMATIAVRHSDHDNWNGGIDYYTVSLTIPFEVYIQIEPTLEEHEKRILDVAKNLWRDLESDVISSIRFIPHRAGLAKGLDTALSPSVLPDFWTSGQLRLFLSHCASFKAEVGALKRALAVYGVCGFVAHDDVAPSQLWQTEIERALRTCEALAAIITDDFPASLWCDQEVGFALGRGLPILPVQCTRPPYGFIGKIQALQLRKGDVLAQKASALVELLIVAPQTAASATSALVHAVATAASFVDAKSTTALLEVVPTLTSAHGEILLNGLRSNSQLKGAYGVPERLRGILKKHGVTVGAA